MSNGRGNGSLPPGVDIDRMIAEAFEALRRHVPVKLSGGLAVLIVLVGWLATGIYQVNPSEVGVILRFGKVTATMPPGLHWHLPWPIERVLKPPVTVVLKEELGFRTVNVGPPARYREVTEESRMLTSDGNIIEVDFIVQYLIKDPIAFLFRVRDASETLRDAAEAAMREVVGHTTINETLTEGRLDVQNRTQTLLQEILDHYGAGLQITTVKLQDVVPPGPVQDAFKDVINAEQDKERMINEAEGFANDILPKARGTAAQLVNEASGYASTVVKKAEGAAKRFELIHQAYLEAPEVTRTRLYLQTLERTLAKADKVIMDEDTAGRVLPLLPLQGAIPTIPLNSQEKGGQK